MSNPDQEKKARSEQLSARFLKVLGVALLSLGIASTLPDREVPPDPWEEVTIDLNISFSGPVKNGYPPLKVPARATVAGKYCAGFMSQFPHDPSRKICLGTRVLYQKVETFAAGDHPDCDSNYLGMPLINCLLAIKPLEDVAGDIFEATEVTFPDFFNYR